MASMMSVVPTTAVFNGARVSARRTARTVRCAATPVAKIGAGKFVATGAIARVGAVSLAAPAAIAAPAAAARRPSFPARAAAAPWRRTPSRRTCAST